MAARALPQSQHQRYKQAIRGDHTSGSDPKRKSTGKDLLPQGIPE